MTDRQVIKMSQKLAITMAITLERQRILSSKLMQMELEDGVKTMVSQEVVRNIFRSKLRELLKGE